MDKELAILAHLFDDPLEGFHIRELARRTRLNHMTVRKYLNKWAKDGLLKKKESRLYTVFLANTTSKKFLNLKRYYNLETLRESHIIEDLEAAYDYPIIVLFGSYAHATNTKDSDIDIFILTNIGKEFPLEKYERICKRKISLHKFTEQEFHAMKTKNPSLLNNICNGITLSGQLEVVYT